MDLLFSSLSIKRFSYLILVVLAAYLLKSQIHHSQACWLVISAFILSLVMMGDSFKRRLTMIIVTGFAAGFASFIAASLISLPIFLVLYFFFITMMCVSAGQRYPAFFLQACIINLFAILAGSINITLVDNLYRFEFICIGVLIAAVLQIVFYPYFVRNELQPYLVISLRNLRKLNMEIFSCLLDPEYKDNIYLYERRLHVQKINFLRAISRLREITWLAETKLSDMEKASHEWWLDKLDGLFENMMDYAQLRRRVSDFTTFSVCSLELKSIVTESDKCLDAVIAHVKHKKYFTNTQQLKLNIEQLENNYHHVLQVASREPFVFMLFIDSVSAFSKKLDELYVHVMPISSHLS